MKQIILFWKRRCLILSVMVSVMVSYHATAQTGKDASDSAKAIKAQGKQDRKTKKLEAKLEKRKAKKEEKQKAKEAEKLANLVTDTEENPVDSLLADSGLDPAQVDGRVLTMLESFAEQGKKQQKILDDAGVKVATGVISIGPRWITSSESSYQQAYIAFDQDTTLEAFSRDRASYVVAAGLHIHPFLKGTWINSEINKLNGKSGTGNKFAQFGLNLVKNLGVIVNVNLLKVSEDASEVSFQQVDGGFGLSMRLSEGVSIAYVLDFFSDRQLLPHYKEQIGNPVTYKGTKLSSLDVSDNDLFTSRIIQARAIRVSIELGKK